MDAESRVTTLLGDPRKAILAMVLPILLSLLVSEVNTLADRAWCSGLGVDALAAISVVRPIYNVYVGLGTGLGVGAAAVISRKIGAGKASEASSCGIQAMILALIFCAILTPTMYLLQSGLLDVVGSEDIHDISVEYMTCYTLCLTLIVMNGVVAGILNGQGAAGLSTAMMMTLAVGNMILDPIFIYTFDMGVSGAAWATVIALAITSFIPFYWYLYRKDTFVRIEKKDFVKDKKARSDILAVGFPEMLELSLMYLFNILLNYFVIICGGTDAVAIYTTSWKIVALGVVPAQAIGGALVSVCSAEYGMRRFDAIADAFRYSIRITMLSMAGVAILIIASAMPIAMAFTTGENTIHIRSELEHVLIIMALFAPFFALVYPSSSTTSSSRSMATLMESR